MFYFVFIGINFTISGADTEQQQHTVKNQYGDG